MKSNSINTSIPASKTVRGYTISRMPIGQFLKASQILQDLPETITKAMFAGEDIADVLDQLKGLTKETLIALFMRAMTVLPEQVVRIFAQLSGITEDAFLTDPNIGLDGLMELAHAWIEVNGIENFIKAAGALLEKVRKVTTKNGFSD